MAYCGPHGIDYLDFLDWSPTGQALAVEWAKRQNDRCGGCGVPHRDWYREDGTPDDTVYTAEAYRCPGCEKRQALDKQLQEAGGYLGGVHVRLVPNLNAERWGGSGARSGSGGRGGRDSAPERLPAPVEGGTAPEVAAGG